MAGAARELLSATRDFLATFGDPVATFVGHLPDMTERPLEQRQLPCLRHLDACAALAEGSAGEEVARFMAERGQRLQWRQTYGEDDFGPRFLQNYGWVELWGERGHFVNDSLACGFLILGPGIVYPDHHHEAEEIYIPLTPGADWSMGSTPFSRRQAGEITHHPSNMTHAMRTADTPLLALYLWRGGSLSARPVVTGSMT